MSKNTVFESFQQSVGFRSYVDKGIRAKLFLISHMQPERWETTFHKIYPTYRISDLQVYIEGINSFIKSNGNSRDVFKHMFDLIDQHVTIAKPVKLKDIATFKKNPSVWKVMTVAFSLKRDATPEQVVWNNNKDVIKLSLLCADVDDISDLLRKTKLRMTYDLKQAFIDLREKKDFLVFDEEQSNTVISLMS